MKKRYTNVSVSFDLELLSKIDNYVETHGGSFSKFIRDAVDAYLDDTPNVTQVNIVDDELMKQAIEVTPKPNGNDKSDFNFDDVDLDR